MRKVGLKTLKNKLSEYVRLAAAGETVIRYRPRSHRRRDRAPLTTGAGLTPFEEKWRSRGLAHTGDANRDTGRRRASLRARVASFDASLDGGSLGRDREDR